MNTITIVFSILLFLFFGAFNFFGFVLIERLLNGNKTKRWVYALLSAINGACSLILTTSWPVAVMYFVALLIMIVEIILFFNASPASAMYGSMAMLINSMCLHGMTAAVVAFVTGLPFSAFSDYMEYLVLIPMATSVLELMIVLLILNLVPLDSVNAAIKLPKQRLFMLIWMGICLSFMFCNTGVYTMGIISNQIVINQLLFCLALLMSCYFMLFNSFKMNQTLKIAEQNNRLSRELDNRKLLQSAFLKDSVFYMQVNLSKNRVLSGSEIHYKSFESANFEYSLWFQRLESHIHPDDREYFKKFVNRENLLELAETGVEPPPFIYRRGESGKYRWIKMNIRLFHCEETGDTLGFGYSFDVDADINREKELLEKSKTDGFTGLLNKATAQSLIREQIRHGVGALYILDIDNLKQANDTMGHEAGDQILKYVSNTLKAAFSCSDIVGRVGGDEFMAFCVKDTSVDDVSTRAARILSTLADISCPARPPYDFTASLGITLISKLTPDFSSAYRQADLALYDVKHSGKNSFSVYGVQSSLFDYA